MSYCRWSSDDFKCDVYVYESVHGGWQTHIAGRRRVGLETLPPSPYEPSRIREMDSVEWLELYRAYHAVLKELPFEDIDLPHSGESFVDRSPGECADRLMKLREIGYHVPQYAIDSLREEQAEMCGSKVP